jgi:nucleotide-binding universal stress UspA family protein
MLLARAGDDTMTETTAVIAERPFVVLLGLDLTDQESSGYAFQQAVRIASRIPSCAVQIVHVAPADASPEELSRLAGLLRLYVAESASAFGVRAGGGLGLHIRQGDAAKEIAQLAADSVADMIIVGTRKRPQLKSLFVGSTASRVMAATDCPVFVAGPRPAPEPSHVIVIEGPCPDCVATRQATQASQWWCARHSETHHVRHHHYSYAPDWSFAEHDSEISATGTD